MKTRREFVRNAALSMAAALTGPAWAETGPADPIAVAGRAPAGTIDWHNHWISPGVIALLKQRTLGPRIETDAGGDLVLLGTSTGPSRRPFSLNPGFTDIDLRLRHLNQTGVERQVISWATTMGLDAVLTAEEAKPLWSAFNEDLSALIHKYPARFSGYAVLPTSDVAWAAQELDRSYRDLGLIGAVLPVGAFQSLEGAKRLSPIFDVTERYGGIIYVHSGPASPAIPGQTVLETPADDAPDVRYQLEWTDTYARAAVTLTQTTFLDAYPNVTVQVAMLGGGVPLLAGWLRLNTPRPGTVDPTSRFRRIYLDASTSRAPHLLDLAAGTFGADRILFGSDYPIATVDKTVAGVAGSALTPDDKARVFVDNGRSLFAAKGRPTS